MEPIFFIEHLSSGSVVLFLCLTEIKLQINHAINNITGYQKHHDQINNVTSMIDGSAIYGSDAKRASMLRSHQGGLLKLTDNYLPIEKPQAPETHDCSIPYHGSSEDKRCFAAGIKLTTHDHILYYMPRAQQPSLI